MKRVGGNQKRGGYLIRGGKNPEGSESGERIWFVGVILSTSQKGSRVL